MRKLYFHIAVAAVLFLCAGFAVRSAEAEMLTLINRARAVNKLPPLKINFEVTRVAKYKCEEMAALGYLSHYSPVYGNPAQMLSSFHIPFETVGENLAAGTHSPYETLRRLWSAPAYRENILYEAYGEIGLGCCRGADGNSYWVLLFIS